MPTTVPVPSSVSQVRCTRCNFRLFLTREEDKATWNATSNRFLDQYEDTPYTCGQCCNYFVIEPIRVHAYTRHFEYCQYRIDVTEEDGKYVARVPFLRSIEWRHTNFERVCTQTILSIDAYLAEHGDQLYES